jgi:hypothetical protein
MRVLYKQRTTRGALPEALVATSKKGCPHLSGMGNLHQQKNSKVLRVTLRFKRFWLEQGSQQDSRRPFHNHAGVLPTAQLSTFCDEHLQRRFGWMRGLRSLTMAGQEGPYQLAVFLHSKCVKLALTLCPQVVLPCNTHHLAAAFIGRRAAHTGCL